MNPHRGVPFSIALLHCWSHFCFNFTNNSTSGPEAVLMNCLAKQLPIEDRNTKMCIIPLLLSQFSHFFPSLFLLSLGTSLILFLCVVVTPRSPATTSYAMAGRPQPHAPWPGNRVHARPDNHTGANMPFPMLARGKSDIHAQWARSTGVSGSQEKLLFSASSPIHLCESIFLGAPPQKAILFCLIQYKIAPETNGEAMSLSHVPVLPPSLNNCHFLSRETTLTKNI